MIGLEEMCNDCLGVNASEELLPAISMDVTFLAFQLCISGMVFVLSCRLIFLLYMAHQCYIRYLFC